MDFDIEEFFCDNGTMEVAMVQANALDKFPRRF